MSCCKPTPDLQYLDTTMHVHVLQPHVDNSIVTAFAQTDRAGKRLLYCEIDYSLDARL